MLLEKPWRTDAVMRLIAGIFVCIYAGWLALSIGHYYGSPQRHSIWFVPLAAVAMLCLLGTAIVLLKHWRLESAFLYLVLLLVLFYTGLLVGGWVIKMAGPLESSVSQMVVASISFQGAALIWVGRFVRDHGLTWSDAFGFRWHWSQSLLVGLASACLFLPVGWGLQQLSAYLLLHLPHMQIQPEEQQAVQVLRVASSWTARVALGVVTILLAPAAEEMLFRGILYPWIKRMGYPRLAFWGTSLGFAAIHMNLMIFLPLLVLAALLILLYERTNNLLAPIAAHSFFNALNFATFYLQR